MKALALLSGGLDSSLAVKLLQEEGIEIEGVSFISPFFDASQAQKAARELRIKLHILDITSELLEIVKNPGYGYGKNMNPCIDCHILMAAHAKKLMEEIKASFIISGEVLGQRLKSQNKQALALVTKRSGTERLLLRPLSARLLASSEAEERGWVEREKLLALSGKSRKPQLALAGKYHLKEYGTPAGGCLLTDPGFSRRLKDLLEHNEYAVDDILLLKLGRHFRSPAGFKIIIGRNKDENEKLKSLSKKGDTTFHVFGHKGPLVVVRQKPSVELAGGTEQLDEETVRAASSLCARYSAGREFPRVKIGYKRLPDGKIEFLIVTPLDAAAVGAMRI
jgi:tRNA U34 2-thiouridine synthase MnmA/TrmU